jgi:hypothetical protein
MDFLSDIGGVLELLCHIFGTIFLWISEESFYLSVISSWFKIKTSQNEKYLIKKSDNYPKLKNFKPNLLQRILLILHLDCFLFD